MQTVRLEVGFAGAIQLKPRMNTNEHGCQKALTRISLMIANFHGHTFWFAPIREVGVCFRPVSSRFHPRSSVVNNSLN
jgi:hypothetical protein